jgi:hypothetical protein
MVSGSLILLFLVNALTFSDSFSDEKAEPCFDLSKVSLKLLKEEPKLFSMPGKENSEFGTEEKTGYQWAKADGIVEKPISELLKRLQNPMTTRNPEITKLEVTEVPVLDAILKQKIKIKVRPVFFMTLEWEEEWLFSTKKGTPGNPESIVISYQKTSGTSHIQHFCGNILLQKIDPHTTGVYLTEEILASRRSARDVYQGLLGTLRILRE